MTKKRIWRTPEEPDDPWISLPGVPGARFRRGGPVTPQIKDHTDSYGEPSTPLPEKEPPPCS